MLCYRIAKQRFSALDGLGGMMADGRWHRRGQPVVYCADSPALAALEVLVHLDLPANLIPTDYLLMQIEIPDDVSVSEFGSSARSGWNVDEEISRQFGSAWLSGLESAVLKVPSVLVPEQHNFIVNPRHPEAAGIAVRSRRTFQFDARLLKR